MTEVDSEELGCEETTEDEGGRPRRCVRIDVDQQGMENSSGWLKIELYGKERLKIYDNLLKRSFMNELLN